MSLVTRCTACGTLFKVVADQLKISDGWVRCGQCGTVFDAQGNLVPEFESAPPPLIENQRPSSGAEPLRDSSFNPQDREALQAAFAPARADPAKAPLPAAVTAPAQLSSPPADTLPAQLSDFSSGFLPPPPVAAAYSPQPAQMASLKTGTSTDTSPDSRADSQSFSPGQLRDSGEIDSETGPSSSSWAASEYPDHKGRLLDVSSTSLSAEPTTLSNPSTGVSPSDSMPPPPPEVDLLGPGTKPTFVQQAQHAKRWRRPWIRFSLSLILLALMAVLGLQVSLHEKDRIATQWPQAKPWLDRLCQYAACQIQAMKSIDSITVDASSFNLINKNSAQLEAATQTYRLSITLKNTGPLAVALPHLELSLQDAQDQPILRRVLSPTDIGMADQAIASGKDMAGSLTLQVNTAQLAGNRINGYRVLAFYP